MTPGGHPGGACHRRGVHRVGARDRLRTGRSGEAEVQHLHHAIRADLDVRGLEIAMDDALFVSGLERRRNETRCQGLVDREAKSLRRAALGRARNPAGERGALNEL